MSVYTYKDSKVIDEITVRKSEGGHNYAYIRAAKDASPESLKEVMQAIEAQGWQMTPYTMDGQPVLEVRGMRGPTQLTTLLESKQWAQGEVKFTQTQDDKKSFKEQLKKRSLAASGLFYLVGDAAFTGYGYKGADKLNMFAGAMYGAGTLSLLGFGRKDQSDLQVASAAKKLAQYLKQNGANLPNECSLDSIVNDHKKGLIRKADDLFRRYPSELMNLFYTLAGASIAKSAYNHMNTHVSDADKQEVFERIRKKKPNANFAEVSKKIDSNHKWEGRLDIGLGTMTGASGTFAMLVKEKAHDPDEPYKKGLEGVWQKIREKPLAIAGVGYMVSTMCHAVSTLKAWETATNERRGTVNYRAVFVVANLIAEVLLMISSKGHGEGVVSDKSVDKTITALAAEMIAKQPAAMQEQLIDYVAGFIGRPDVLAMKNEDARELLQREVEHMRGNPWMKAEKMDACKQSAKLANAGPAEIEKCMSDSSHAWTSKVAAESQPSPSL